MPLLLCCARSGGMELLFNNQPVHHLVLPRYYQPATTVQAAPTPKGMPTTRPEPIEESAEGAQETDVRFLIWWLREFELEDRDRPELFSQGETVYVSPVPAFLSPRKSVGLTAVFFVCPALHRRPGILVLINSTDWELEGELDYVLQEGDEVVFISTLHGG